MIKYFIYTTITMAFLFGPKVSDAQNIVTAQTKALPGDEEFDNLDSLRIQLDRKFSNSIEYYAEKEKMNRKYREIGLQLWYKYPKNPKKYYWLKTTITVPIFPFYWHDVLEGAYIRRYVSGVPKVEVDYNLISKWENVYPSLRNELLNSSIVTKKEKVEFRRNELFQFLMLQQNSYYRKDKKLNLDNLKSYFLASAYDYWDKKSGIDPLSVMGEDPIKVINVIFSTRNTYRLTEADLKEFVESILKESKLQESKQWALAKKRYLALYSNPLDMTFKTLDGETISLSKLRGKVVLVDFWATWCRSCISMMPRIKKVYEKYKDQGFEVISVSVDSEEQIEGVKAVEHKIGADWPIAIIGGAKEKDRNIKSQYREIWDRYAFYTDAVPVIFILNKEGLLVSESEVVANNTLEERVKNLLAEPYPSKSN